jgi:hypothetical protein
MSSRKEVQLHGLIWQDELMLHTYLATREETDTIPYTSDIDLPAEYNRLDQCDLSIKTTGSNTVCMADCLRQFDIVSSGKPIHMVVIHYKQKGNTKNILSITEVDLTNSAELLFGSLTRMQIECLVSLVKKVPSNRKPTTTEHGHLYELKDALQQLSGVMCLNIKCNSTQSRLQCSLNRFQQFMEDHPERVIAKGTHEFRGGSITPQLVSSPRVLKTKAGPKNGLKPKAGPKPKQPKV